ncbi:MAG TPA: SDR family oxidoreductase [Spirochaetia bacterium]|nr:SDR family oxidoreductase [Spirochaetia bacterium]
MGIEVAGAVALVTGAGSGVGEAVAVGLAARGMRVALVGRSTEKLEAARARIQARGGASLVAPCDVGDAAQVSDLKRAVLTGLGCPRVLVNAAGRYGECLPIADSDPLDWTATLQVNLVGAYLVCNAFLKEMISQGWGRIINVTSAGSLPEPTGIASAYQLSKVGLNHFTRQLARELDGTDVTANAIHPGEVKSPMWEAIRSDAAGRGEPGRGALDWAAWVERTGGDPPEKTLERILELLDPGSEAVSGQFLWIRDGLQKPRPTW